MEGKKGRVGASVVQVVGWRGRSSGRGWGDRCIGAVNVVRGKE